MLNVDADQPHGDFIVVDKSDGTLKVYKAGGASRAGERRQREDRAKAKSQLSKARLRSRSARSSPSSR